MHSYDLAGRDRVVVALFVVSIFCVWLFHIGVGTIGYEPPWWVSVPSYAAFYSVLYWLFDRYVWRFGLVSKLGLLRVPDLNGAWIGTVTSSYADGDPVQPFPVTIVQRWSKISITFETEHSRSRSVAASLRADDPLTPELYYLYSNEPYPTAPDTMHAHRGTASLRLKGAVLEGDYYTGRDRRENGALKLTRFC